MKEQVTGQVFIVPNKATKPECLFNPEREMEKLRRLAGLEVNEKDEIIQVWIVSEECSNWADTCDGFQISCGMETIEYKEGEEKLLGYFPHYLPARLFKGKKEGDEVTLFCKEYNVNIKLVCNQLDYRYKRFGKFEEVYEYATT